jgi:hypothetical protein
MMLAFSLPIASFFAFLLCTTLLGVMLMFSPIPFPLTGLFA